MIKTVVCKNIKLYLHIKMLNKKDRIKYGSSKGIYIVYRMQQTLTWCIKKKKKEKEKQTNRQTKNTNQLKTPEQFYPFTACRRMPQIIDCKRMSNNIFQHKRLQYMNYLSRNWTGSTSKRIVKINSKRDNNTISK